MTACIAMPVEYLAFMWSSAKDGRVNRVVYRYFDCHVILDCNLSGWLPVEFGVRPGCSCVYPILFLVAIGWFTKRTPSDKLRGIQWTLLILLDFDSADNLAALSFKYVHLKERLTYSTASRNRRS